MPDISVITPLHDKGPYIRETICSLQQQSFSNWELLVVENHSADDGPERVQRMSEEDSRIHLLQAPPEVRGPGAARNHGIERATGKYLLFLDADDLLEPDHLESLFQRAMETDADIVASNWLEFRDVNGGDGAAPDRRSMEQKQAGGSTVGRRSLADSTIAFAPWAIHCALVRTDCVTNDRRWLPELDSFPSEDTAFWFRVIHGRKVAYTDEYTAIYRTETTNQRNRHENIPLWLKAMKAITGSNIQFLKDRHLIPSPRQSEVLFRVWEAFALRACVAGDKQEQYIAARTSRAWLKTCITSGGGTWPLYLRKCFGTRNVRFLLRLRRRLSQCRQ